MKREFLEGLGLEKEAIDKIMAENGKDIEAEKTKTTAMTSERDTLQKSLEDANKTIKGYKDQDIDAIKKSATDWEEKAKQAEKALEDTRIESALDKALSETQTIDADLLKKFLDRETILFKDGKFTGLNEQIEGLKKDKPYLFKSEEKPPEGGQGNGNGFDPYVPPNGDDGGTGKSVMQQQVDTIFGF